MTLIDRTGEQYLVHSAESWKLLFDRTRSPQRVKGKHTLLDRLGYPVFRDRSGLCHVAVEIPLPEEFRAILAQHGFRFVWKLEKNKCPKTPFRVAPRKP